VFLCVVSVCAGFECFFLSCIILLCFLKCQVHKIITVLVIKHGKSQVFEVGSVSWSCCWFFNVLDLHQLYQAYTSYEIVVASHLCTKGAPTGYQYSSIEARLLFCDILLYCWLVGHPVWEKAWAPRDFHNSEVIGTFFVYFFLSFFFVTLKRADICNIGIAGR
jgi:hypothetical protein